MLTRLKENKAGNKADKKEIQSHGPIPVIPKVITIQVSPYGKCINVPSKYIRKFLQVLSHTWNPNQPLYKRIIILVKIRLSRGGYPILETLS
jgi:hypothetical protein